MTQEKAMELAQNSVCAQEGTLGQKGNYNGNSKTWWIGLELNEPMEGCNPACVVDIENRTASINWRCMGLIQ